MMNLRAHSGFVLRPVMVVAGLAFLAACGGGAATTPAVEEPVIPTPTDPTPTTPTPPVTPGVPATGAQLRSGATALVSDFTPITYTGLNAIPTSSGARYEGYLYGTLANTSDAVTDTLIGDMTLNVTFNPTSVGVTGTVTNFADEDDGKLTGSLSLTNGSLNRNGNPSNDATLTVAANGTLKDSANRNLVVGVQLEGDFLGGAYNGIGGETLGAVTVGGVSQDFDGGFIGSR